MSRSHRKSPARPRIRPFRRMRQARLILVLGAALGSVWGLRQSEMFYPVAQPYARSLYDHWIDADGDCQDTRQEVLIRDSLTPVRLTANGCRVVSGRWIDPYSGDVFTDPSGMDIDHLVPLAEAHRSGADTWNKGRRRAFANDLSSPLTLVATGASANRSKSDGDPLSWLPWPPTRWCAYTGAWRAVKARWGLQPDRLEAWWTEAIMWTCDQIQTQQ